MSPCVPLHTNPRNAISSATFSTPYAQLQSRLFRLPRELRDLVYGYYLTSETGLAYNYDKNKITTANGGHIDLSLMYTCCVAAAELRGLALQLNTLNFRTSYTDASWENRGNFHSALFQLNCTKKNLLDKVAHRCLTEEKEKKINLAYPQFAPILREWRLVERIPTFIAYDYGEAPSIVRDFVSFALGVLRDSPYFTEAAGWLRTYDIRGQAILHPDPWQDPTNEAIEEIIGVAYSGDRPELWEPQKYPVSAATCAIRFLSSLPASTRMDLRELNLIEDHGSISYPECHARGLIPFCRENRNLRVQRRVSLWWNLLWQNGRTRSEIRASSISLSVAKWMVEANILPLLGMPNKAFKMIFENDSAPRNSEIFDALHRDAAWQDALDLGYERGYLPSPTWLQRRLRIGYRYELFPQILRGIVDRKSTIGCDFPTRSICSAETIMNERKGGSVEEWTGNTFDHQGQMLQTPSYIPPWCSDWPRNPDW